jgi:hypothetical protein
MKQFLVLAVLLILISQSFSIAQVPDWAKGVVWYQIFPERFAFLRDGKLKIGLPIGSHRMSGKQILGDTLGIIFMKEDMVVISRESLIILTI